VSDSNQYSLLGQRRFAPFFLTQLLGAFNDNIFRNGLIILITFQGVRVLGMNASQIANAAGALFILPFFLFSAAAGQLADKYEKSRLIRLIKLLEIALMILAAFAFINESYVALLFVLFLMGCQSTMFGPVKYAYLPQQLATDELVGGNALVEFGTYTAIILGLIVGGISVAIDNTDQVVISACLIGVAVIGYVASRSIPITKAPDPLRLTGTCGPKRGESSNSHERSKVFSCRYSASHGSGFSAPLSRYRFPRIRWIFLTVARKSPLYYWLRLPLASGSARYFASECRIGESNWAWCLSVRSA
jgi:MFS family permease